MQLKVETDALKGIYVLLRSNRVREHLHSFPADTGVAKAQKEHADWLERLRDRFNEANWLQWDSAKPGADTAAPITLTPAEYGTIDEALNHVLNGGGADIRDEIYDEKELSSASIEELFEKRLALIKKARKALPPAAGANEYELQGIFPQALGHRALSEGPWWMKAPNKRVQIVKLRKDPEDGWIALNFEVKEALSVQSLQEQGYLLICPVKALTEEEIADAGE